MANYFSPIGNGVAFVDSSGNPRAGARLFTYEAGSSTKKTTYKNQAGSASHTNPIVVDADGYLPDNLWLIGSQEYKLLLAPPGSDDPPSSTIDQWDDVSGVNDVAGAVTDEWVSGPTPTFVSTTQFTAAGDQTETFQVNRRIKCTVGAGTVYGIISASAFGALTTVTVILDSGALDAGLTAVAVGLLRASNRSLDALAVDRDTILSHFGIPRNLALSASVGSNALTMAVKGRNGSDASASNRISVPMRSSTAANGDFNWRTITAALSLTISSGSTLGHNSAIKQYVYWYLIDNSGTLELAASSKFFGMHGIVSTTAEGGAGASDSGTVMYSTTARTNVPFLCIGYTEDTQATAGTWATAPSNVHLAPFTHPVISFSAHKNGTNQVGVQTGTDTKATFGTEIFDNGGLFDSGSNRWIPPPGSIDLSAAVLFTVSVDAARVRAMIYKNGSVFKRVVNLSPGTAPTGSTIHIHDECNGTDFYEFFVEQNTGADKIIDGTAADTYFMGAWSPLRS